MCFQNLVDFSWNEPSNVRAKIFFEENDAAFTNARTCNNRTAQPPVPLANVAFSVLAHDPLPDTCTATSSFFSVSSLCPSPASSSSCLPPLFVGVLLFFFGLFAFTFLFLALGARTPPVADATAAAILHDEYGQVMYVVMPYCVFMEAMLSCLIHGGNISRISPFQFRGLVGMGEMGHVGPHLC